MSSEEIFLSLPENHRLHGLLVKLTENRVVREKKFKDASLRFQ